MGDFKPSTKPTPPAFTVSICGMLTLILAFFTLLASSAMERQSDLMAPDKEKSIVSVGSLGMPEAMSDQEKAAVFEHVRRKFNVPYASGDFDVSASEGSNDTVEGRRSNQRVDLRIMSNSKTRARALRQRDGSDG